MALRDPYADDELDSHGRPLSEFTGDTSADLDSSPAGTDIAGTPENPGKPADGTV